MVSSPRRSIEKPCRPSAYTVYHGGINMSTFCDVGGGFFFRPSLPWCVGIRNGVEGGEAPPSKTATEDDVIRCQLPPPCGYFIFSLFLMTHTKRCNLWDKGVKRPSVPNHPAKRLGVKRESEANPFSGFGRILGNIQDYPPGPLSMTSSCRDEVCLLSSRMLPIFLFPPINPFLILLSEG